MQKAAFAMTDGAVEIANPLRLCPSDRIVLDDKKARRIARDLGLRPIGTVGVVVRAKREGIVPA